jgi:ribosomal 30S subunit maturation factor RimM
MEGAAQDLIVIGQPGRPDVLLPDVPEFVLSVDREAGRLLVRPPEGLLEESDER